MAAAQFVLKILLLWNLIAIVSSRQIISPVAFIGRSSISSFSPSVNQYERSHYNRKHDVPCPVIAMAIGPEDDNEEDGTIDEKLNTFLDKPFFDPDSPSNTDNWFANLVKNDYESAESLYVGVIMIFGVIVSQELLRIVKYGSPFGSGGGNLF